MTQAENEEKRVMRVIVCRPGELAEVEEIDTDLKSMQGVVGGFIEEYMPFTGDDPREGDIAIICNVQSSLMCSMKFSFLVLLEITCLQIGISIFAQHNI